MFQERVNSVLLFFKRFITRGPEKRSDLPKTNYYRCRGFLVILLRTKHFDLLHPKLFSIWFEGF